MKYVFYNIRNLAKNERFIFTVMLLCVFVSAWIMTFSYGLYHNYSEMLKEPDDLGDELRPETAEDITLTRGDVTRFILELSPATLDAMDNIVIQGFTEPFESKEGDMATLPMTSRVVVRNGSFVPSPYIVQFWNDESMIISGRYISDDEEANGENVVMIPYKTIHQLRDDHPELFKDEETMLLNGEEFKVIGEHTSFGVITPFLTIPEDSGVFPPLMCFTEPITRKQYSDIVNTAERVLPGVFIFTKIDLGDEQAFMIYNNMLIVAVIIAALTIINFAFLYNFILHKRARTLAIMRICGCTKGRARLICLGECCLICIPTFLIGMLTYIPFLHGVLGRVFEYIEEAYSLVVYGLLFAIFVAALFIIMSILLTRVIRRELAEGRKGGAI